MISNRVIVTQGVINALPNTADANWLAECVTRMENKDWGDTHPDDHNLNDRAFDSKLRFSRIVAKFINIKRDAEIFIITEKFTDGKPITTVMLTQEY
jgi:hypothetical protein